MLVLDFISFLLVPMVSTRYTHVDPHRLHDQLHGAGFDFSLRRQGSVLYSSGMGEGKQAPNTDAEDLLAVSDVLRGNVDAFRVIVDRYRGLVFRLALSSLGSREEAEEAAQEVFLRAFRSLRSFHLGNRFLPWLYSIASNYLKTKAVRVRRIQERLVRGGEERALAPECDDPQASTQRSQSLAEVREAVAALPPSIRDVVRLYYFEGMSVEQVGGALGIGGENVKSRLLRGRKKLREALEPDATGSGISGYTGDEGERGRSGEHG